MKMKIVFLKGLPASGKSTYAKALLKDHPARYKRINKDDLRAMLDGSKWSKANEKFVLEVRDTLIHKSLYAGYSPIIDDTNFASVHRETIDRFAKEFGVEVEEKFFDVDVNECLARDAQRVNCVGAKVIMGMYHQYLAKDPPVLEQNDDLPKAILCDIDGTLALMRGRRGPFDWHKVDLDDANHTILDIVKNHKNSGCKIILMSGRDGCCRDKTIQWLETHGVPYDELHMRDAGNTEKDSVIKERLFNQNVRDKYRILFVLDDRDQVVKKWREMGLVCLQVAEGNF